MTIRLLCGALALLLLAAPLGAMLCEGCAPANCPLNEKAEAPPEPSPVEGHCHGAEASSEETAEMAGMAPVVPRTMTAADCCVVGTVPEPETQAIPAAAVAFEVALELTTQIDLSAVAPNRQERRCLRPPRPLYASLFTLHSAFLI